MTANFLDRYALTALLAAQALLWTLAPALSHTAPPLDVVEMYAWGREGVVATFKHPNLPGLVLEATRRLTGAAGWPAYLMSQIFVCATLWAAYALGCELLDKRRALAGALLLTGVVFFSWPTPEFNHNVAQMPFWALVILALWRAGTHGKLLDWALLGLFAGLSLWAKYSSAILLVVAAGWILYDATTRRRILSPGPWLALIVFALVVAPQLQWLIAHDFQPFAYAERRASGAPWYSPFEFLATMLADHLPLIILLATAGLMGKVADNAPPAPERRKLVFLLIMGLGPMLLTAVLGLLGGAGIRPSWGAAMFAPSGLLAVALLSARFSEARLKRLVIGAGVLLLLGSGLYFGHMKYGARFTHDPLRGNWPQAEMSRALGRQWSTQTQERPLRVVAGDIWTAGLVGLEVREPPSVLINGDYAISPWVTPEEVQREGMLVVWPADRPPRDELAPLIAGLPVQSISAPYPNSPEVAPLVINYVIVPPAASGP
ncbi:glycosyltransferase family 39 protein [Terricaulis sp.]|uniref:glycosyltransferase family 39 protein n=1 Tax=Terricaulis sp. TaxID=2768686 RepID=UPI003785231F